MKACGNENVQSEPREPEGRPASIYLVTDMAVVSCISRVDGRAVKISCVIDRQATLRATAVGPAGEVVQRLKPYALREWLDLHRPARLQHQRWRIAGHQRVDRH